MFSTQSIITYHIAYFIQSSLDFSQMSVYNELIHSTVIISQNMNTEWGSQLIALITLFILPIWTEEFWRQLVCVVLGDWRSCVSVSYTHLDVYKRQKRFCILLFWICGLFFTIWLFMYVSVMNLLFSVFVCCLFFVLCRSLLTIVLLYPLDSARYFVVFSSSL